MADTLEQLYNEKPGLFSKATDPFALKDLANDIAVSEYGLGESSGGKGDALRHLLASAIMAKRHGDTYAEVIGNLHESPLPWVGAPAQAPEDRDMDLKNNELGRKLAKSSTSYVDMVNQARRMIDNGSAQLVYDRAKPTQAPDYNKDVTFKEWLNKYTSK